jgi:hypothetical protein
MTRLADVAPQTTIASSWGNAIRDQTVWQFASAAERNAVAASVLHDGVLAYTTADQTLAMWIGANNAWRVLREPWQNLPLSSVTIHTNRDYSPVSGWVQSRRFDCDQQEWRCKVQVGPTDAAQPFALLVVPGGLQMNGDLLVTLGWAIMTDSVTGLQLGGLAVPYSSGVQTAFSLVTPNQAGGVFQQPGAPGSMAWSGGAGSIFSALIRVEYP